MTDTNPIPSIILADPALRLALAGERVEVRVPVRPRYFHPDFGKPMWDRAWIDPTYGGSCLKVPYSKDAPLGGTTQGYFAPWDVGEVVAAKEKIWIEDIDSDDGGGTMVIYRADKQFQIFDDGKPLQRRDDFGDAHWADGPYVTTYCRYVQARRMPLVYVRLHLTLLAVRVEQHDGAWGWVGEFQKKESVGKC